MSDDEKKRRAVIGLVRELVPGEEGGGDDEAGGQAQFAHPTLVEEQQVAADGILARIKAKFPRTVLGGFAGSGKSLTTGHIARALENTGLRLAYCAPTGRAASILRRSLKAQGIDPLFCGTVHRLIYRPVVDSQGSIKGWDKAAELPYDVVICDEGSMVGSKILADLESYGMPLLFVGDHGQLPPVGEEVDLMAHPDFVLEKVQRQALHNPVIALSMLMRRGADWVSFVKEVRRQGHTEVSMCKPWDYMDTVIAAFDGFPTKPLGDDPVVITRTNDHRVKLNAAVRTACLGVVKAAEPVVAGERVIVLKNAYMESGTLVANGFRGKVTSLGYSRNPNHHALNLVFPDEGMGIDQTRCNRHQFGRSKTFGKLDDIPGSPNDWDEVGLLVDYGYAVTCHKYQGSQTRHAIVHLNRGPMTEDEWRRWTYTAVTRTTEKLTLVC